MKNLEESLVANIPPFRKLARTQIREILDLAVPKRIETGGVIFDQGEPAKRFFLLLDGYIRVIKTTPDGDQLIATHIPSGQLFGIAIALGMTSYPATSVAARECLILEWSNTNWQSFVNQYDGFATETYATIGLRLEEAQKRIIELATQQVEKRVASVILRLIDQAGKQVDGGIEIDFPITRQNISEMTGTTLHTVSRLLSGWEKDGIVASKRSQITVINPRRLTLISEAHH